MELTARIIIGFIAFLHLYFLWLEMFAWTTRAKKVFTGFAPEFFEKTKSMAANQGLYNGFLAAGLIWSFFIPDPIWQNKVASFFLGCVIAAGIFGAITVSKKIFYVQALPAIIGIILIFTL
ncbi:MAG: DUF1304 domain-containing protein [Balneola sp.]